MRQRRSLSPTIQIKSGRYDPQVSGIYFAAQFDVEGCQDFPSQETLERNSFHFGVETD